MKIKYCGIGNLSFVAEDETFVGKVIFQVSDDSLTAPMQAVAGHDVEIAVRLKGTSSWPFERVQAEILAKAAGVLSLASKHIDGATIQSLAEYNARMDAEDEAARQAEFDKSLSGEA